MLEIKNQGFTSPVPDLNFNELVHSRKVPRLPSSLQNSVLPCRCPGLPHLAFSCSKCPPSTTLLCHSFTCCEDHLLQNGPQMSSSLSKLWVVPSFLLKKVLNQFSSPPYMEPTQLSPGKYCILGPCYSLSGSSATPLLSSWEAILPPLCVTRPPTATEARTCGFQHLNPPLSSTHQITPLSEHSLDRPHGRSVMAPSPNWWLWKQGARFWFLSPSSVMAPYTSSSLTFSETLSSSKSFLRQLTNTP